MLRYMYFAPLKRYLYEEAMITLSVNRLSYFVKLVKCLLLFTPMFTPYRGYFSEVSVIDLLKGTIPMPQ